MKQSVLYIPVINKAFTDLNPVQAGEEKCTPLHSFGPATRAFHLMHYVVSGKGTLIKDGRETKVEAGEVFLINPGEICIYTADKEEPWHYIWIGFTGRLAPQFESLGDIFSAPRSVFESIPLAGDYGDFSSEYLAAQLFTLYAMLFSQNGGKTDYVTQTCDYIKANYASDLTVGSIAEIIGVDRTYLSKLFHKKTGTTIQEYLINVRFHHAEIFLKNGHLVYETAIMCGYNDVSNFSRMYKRKKGVSPKEAMLKCGSFA